MKSIYLKLLSYREILVCSFPVDMDQARRFASETQLGSDWTNGLRLWSGEISHVSGSKIMTAARSHAEPLARKWKCVQLANGRNAKWQLEAIPAPYCLTTHRVACFWRATVVRGHYTGRPSSDLAVHTDDESNACYFAEEPVQVSVYAVTLSVPIIIAQLLKFVHLGVKIMLPVVSSALLCPLSCQL
jgi:hypothetical protein